MIENVNTASIVNEIREQFTAYNTALDSGAVELLNGFFWNSPSTVRFGPTETLFGKDSIASFRLQRWKASTQSRQLVSVAITALGNDCGTTNALFLNPEGKKVANHRPGQGFQKVGESSLRTSVLPRQTPHASRLDDRSI